MSTSQEEAASREIIIPATPGSSEPSKSPHQPKKWRLWGGVGFAFVLLAAYAKPLLLLVDHAARSDLHSHILLVPFVSAYLLYLRRGQLPRNPVMDIPLAIGSMAGGFAVLGIIWWLDFAERAPSVNDHLALLTLSFLCFLAAGGCFLFGRAWMRAGAFPFGYLIFMVPMPDAMADALENASKSASAEVANLLFQLSGTPFLRQGAMFQLPNIAIEVAKECSGIRSSWVLLMTSVLAANLFLETRWRRLALVAFVIPLGILRNGFRILVIGLLCVNAGPQMIHSLIHRRGGPAFFVLSLIPFFLMLWWLHRGDVRVRRALR